VNSNTNETKMKVCKTCIELLPYDSYHKDKKRLDGHNNECKKCSIERTIRNRKKKMESEEYRNKVNEKAKLKMRERRKDPEYRERDIQQKRDYYLENKEKISGKYKEYVKSERGRMVKKRNAQQRIARKRELLSTFTAKQWESCLLHFNQSCAYCGSKEDIHQEHFVPVSKGGEYTIKNIIPACEYCNTRKNDKSFFDWYAEQTYYNERREKKILKYLGYSQRKQQISLF